MFVCVHNLRGFMECRCSRVRVLVFVCVLMVDQRRGLEQKGMKDEDTVTCYRGQQLSGLRS